MRAWENQKLRRNEELPTPEQIVSMAEGIKDDRTRALFIIGYLTAGRVSELCKELRKESFDMVKVKERQILLISMPNRKNKRVKLKDIPIPIDREGKLIEMVLPYINSLPDEGVLFDFSKQWAWKLLGDAVDMNPHWLRHIRLTHLVTYYKASDQMLVKFAGWTDSRPAKHYMEITWKDMAEVMK